jgi:hypothetical protein
MIRQRLMIRTSTLYGKRLEEFAEVLHNLDVFEPLLKRGATHERQRCHWLLCEGLKLMGKVLVFNQISLDGFFVDATGDMSWAHQNDAERNPIMLGRGRTLFEGVSRPLRLHLSVTRRFGNGNVLLCYEPSV